MTVEIQPRDSHNQELLANAHPPGRENPRPAPSYNMVVLGGGTAGLVSAAGAAGLGARVALVERALMGGDCLNTGCVPSKAILRSARVRGELREARDMGFRVAEGAEADFPAIMERMRRIRARISHHDSVKRFSDLGIDVFLGEGRFTSARTVEVGGATLRFSKAVIATGGRPFVPPIEGLGEAGHLTSDSVWSLTELPPSLAVIGSGPIGCELAQAFRRFGSEVTILSRSGRLLPRDDQEASAAVRRSLERDGVEMILDSRVEGAGREGPGRVLRFSRDGREDQRRFSAVLVATGRRPNMEGLGLEAAGVKQDRAGVIVDDRMRTSNPRIYAAGDICMDRKFTHAADAAARLVIQNSLFMGRKKLSAVTIPWTTYTDPEVAHVGMDAAGAEKEGDGVTTYVRRFEEVDRAIADGEEDGFVKVHVRAGSDRILGATIVARHAGEMISELTLAMKAGVGLSGLAGVIHPYPTQAEAIRQLGDQYNRTKLTPLVKKAFSRWLRWTR